MPDDFILYQHYLHSAFEVLHNKHIWFVYRVQLEKPNYNDVDRKTLTTEVSESHSGQIVLHPHNHCLHSSIYFVSLLILHLGSVGSVGS